MTVITSARVGLLVAEAVLGVGLLLMPPLVLEMARSATSAAWLWQLAGGALFCLALGSLAQARTGAGSIAEVTARVLGTKAGTSVTALYLGGFTAGQAAVALAAIRLAAAGVGADVGRAWLAALAIPVAAGLASSLGLGLGTGLRRIRLAVTWLLALVLCRTPVIFSAAGLVPRSANGGFWTAVFLLLFAGVGWESVARRTTGLPGPPGVAAVVAVAAVTVAAAYGTLVLILGPSPSGLSASTASPDLAGRVAALATAAVLCLYCLTNIGAAAGFARALRHGPDCDGTAPRGSRKLVAPVAIGLTSAGMIAAGAALGWGVPELLAGPAIATWAGYLVALTAVARRGPLAGRVVTVPAAAALLPALPLGLWELRW